MNRTKRAWRPLFGDWRSGHYGADKKAHFFVYKFADSEKSAACGVRTNDTYKKAGRWSTAENACYDCLAYAASGR